MTSLVAASLGRVGPRLSHSYLSHPYLSHPIPTLHAYSRDTLMQRLCNVLAAEPYQSPFPAVDKNQIISFRPLVMCSNDVKVTDGAVREVGAECVMANYPDGSTGRPCEL